MPSSSDMATRVVSAQATGYYEPMREMLQTYRDEGRSQRWIAAKTNVSRQTIVTASKALEIVFPRNVETMLAGRRHVRELLAKTRSETPHYENKALDPFVQVIRVYTAAWDRGW